MLLWKMDREIALLLPCGAPWPPVEKDLLDGWVSSGRRASNASAVKEMQRERGNAEEEEKRKKKKKRKKKEEEGGCGLRYVVGGEQKRGERRWLVVGRCCGGAAEEKKRERWTASSYLNYGKKKKTGR